MRAIVLGVAGVLAGLGVLDGSAGGRAARADVAIDMAADVGAVIGHGPLAARLDPMISVRGGATITLGAWMLDGGIALMDTRNEAPAATAARGATSSGDLDAFGWSVGARRYVAASPIGASFVGAGYSVMALTSERMAGASVGRLQGPRLTAGLDFIINARGRRAGLGLAASYQWLVASFDGGGRSHGGYAGLELTIVHGFGTCRGQTSTICSDRR